MSECRAQSLGELITAEALCQVDSWIAKYPSDQRQSAVMGALMVVQEEKSRLTPELMDAVALYLGMPPIAVYEVASFYTMYQCNPVGKHLINVCTNISCKLRDADLIVDYLENKLSIKMGETTADGLFTLRKAECLGACVNAPMMQIDKTYHENLSPEKIDTILAMVAGEE